MNILIIDGQGGGIGRQLVENIKKAFPEQKIKPELIELQRAKMRLQLDAVPRILLSDRSA